MSSNMQSDIERRSGIEDESDVSSLGSAGLGDDVDASDDLNGVGGLMTDSVLEIKWKREEEKSQEGDRKESEDGQMKHTGHDRKDCGDSVLQQSDLGRRTFSNFTRVAAPTAAFGEHNYAEKRENSGESGSTKMKTPYSTDSLVQRMYRYVTAKKNLTDFLSWFEGDFDNHAQIEAERAAGMLPREHGGHEHIHCSLRLIGDDLLFAKYYFNGDPREVFRSRLYKVHVSDRYERGLIEMRIYRFYEETERKLKAHNYDVAVLEYGDDDLYEWLQGCEVFWERYDPDSSALEGPDEACKTLGIQPGPRFVGYMKGGGCELYSREIGGQIRIMDDLLLTSGDLWVNDRGFDESGSFVYGNQRGEPYKMKRVDPSGNLGWTLTSDMGPPPGYKP